MTDPRYRRAPGLITYWDGPQAVCFVWQTGTRIPVSPQIFGVLHSMTDWNSAKQLREQIAPDEDIDRTQELLDLLASLQLVELETASASQSKWSHWSPEATFFHFGTKNQTFQTDLRQRNRELVEKAIHEPRPPVTKHIEGRRHQVPPTEGGLAPLDTVLKKRRTWRRFAGQPVPISKLATVLDLTFGVRATGEVPGQGSIVLKTSPSAGARHPIEAYVLAWNVDGLQAGAYHYDSVAKELVELGRPLVADDIPRLLAHQTFFAGAGAAVVLCPVFERTMWRYEHSRAYRAILIDAGHLGQTFCLLATALGLAPFTTMAFREVGLEELLRLDGISECPVYVVGVGIPDQSPDAQENPGKWSD